MTAKAPRARRGERGFALLIVLWTVALLALIGVQITGAGRSAAQLAANLRDAAVTEAAADGAVQDAVFHLLDSSARHWRADGTARALRLGAVQVELRIENESGKVNPNTASPALLAAVLREVGADSASAERIAAAILDWRFPGNQARPSGAKAPEYRAAGRYYAPPGAPMQNVAEVGEVLGMTPELMARLRPHLSIWHEGDPDPVSADPVVRRALARLVSPHAADGSGADESVVRITAAASGPAGSRFLRRAVVRLGASDRRTLYRVLSWTAGED